MKEIQMRKYKTLQKVYKELQKNPDDPRHGIYGYNSGCRCEKCASAHKKYNDERKEKKRAEMIADPNHPLHGTKPGGRYGCPCGECEKARKLIEKEARERRKQRMAMYSV